ncbi:hypothetical protein O7621_17070 [Solwaraspora sp. WMMD937]|uniref:hypothetical protein n=1 Tax=Solwaraspora sp. WMMD937 TaxID=3016090 RepID=UPI00249A84BA|nr:hypothetical protein [Solwaraspora sp. WMMD937]WFE19637.1 hypothetical protein O7621_17070 [Solwaraspora sp. WMMD937]
MRDIELLLRAQASMATFLAELPSDRLLDLVEGRARLALVEPSGGVAATTTEPPSVVPVAAPSVEPVAVSAADPAPAQVIRRPPRSRRQTVPAEPFDAGAVVTQLRACQTIDEATERLASLKLGVNQLRAVAKTLNVPSSGRKDEVAKRILNLLVGGRGKHANLRRG